MTSVIKIPVTISRFGRLSLLMIASSYFISCPSGNAPSSASPQSVFTNAPGSPVAVQGGPGNVLIGDLNNDRKLDLVVASARARSITVLEGKGNGQFGAALSNTTVAEAPGEIALGDLNGDGKLDVAVTSHDSYGVVLLTGDGKGGLAQSPASPIVMKLGQHPHTHGLAVADMNRDNKLDLITCNSADNDISLALGDGLVTLLGSQSRSPLVPARTLLPSATLITTVGRISSQLRPRLDQQGANNFHSAAR